MLKNKSIGFIFFCLLAVFNLYGQSTDFDVLISKGTTAYDQGKYPEALEYFKQAYKLDKKSEKACYQLALGYLAVGENENAAIYSGKLMDDENDYRKDAYLVNASAWENLGRQFKAKKMYEEGLKLYPSSYLLHYNLALTLNDLKDYDKAMDHVEAAIALKPDHASSHFLLAYIMNNKGERIQSMFPLYYFLLLEPSTERSVRAYEFLELLWDKGLSAKEQKDIRLAKAGFSYNDFAQVELTLSEAKKQSDSKVPLEKFVNNTESLFHILSEMPEDKKGIWWEFYVKFFNTIQRGNLTEAYSYYISNCKYNEEVKIWSGDHIDDLQRFMEWAKKLDL